MADPAPSFSGLDLSSFNQLMTILCILALALSLAGLLALALVRLHLKIKAQSYEAKRRRAMIDLQLGYGHPPAWYHKGNALDEVLVGVKRLASRKGVPPQYVNAVLEKEVNLRRLIWYMGALEDLSATRVEQQMATADQIAEWSVGEGRARSLA